MNKIISFVILVASLLPSRALSAPEPLRGDFDDAMLREAVAPDYPEVARQTKSEGEVVVEFVVEAEGTVSRATVKSSTDEQFNAAALAAVQQWKFASASFEGKAAASAMEVEIPFKLSPGAKEHLQTFSPRPLPIIPAKSILAPDPDYPPELAHSNLPGRVTLEFSVGTQGTAVSPKVLWAPHVAFVAEALRVLEKYRFEPRHQGPLPLQSDPMQGEVEFGSTGVTLKEVLAFNQIEVIEEGKFSRLPGPAVLAEPAYPRNRLLADEAGSATVVFLVTEKGAVTNVVLQKSSELEFGAALVAAVETWRFEPALYLNQPGAAQLSVSYKFTPPAEGPINRLAHALKPGGEGVGGASKLDERLRPLWRVPPTYPQALRADNPTGKATIEFIIDREGRARLPMVVSASHPEFGWAAAAAVTQWVFAPPLRGGQPVDVKASIPFDFAPPVD